MYANGSLASMYASKPLAYICVSSALRFQLHKKWDKVEVREETTGALMS